MYISCNFYCVYSGRSRANRINSRWGKILELKGEKNFSVKRRELFSFLLYLELHRTRYVLQEGFLLARRQTCVFVQCWKQISDNNILLNYLLHAEKF